MRNIEKHPITRSEVVCFLERERDSRRFGASDDEMRSALYQKAIEAVRSHDFSADASASDKIHTDVREHSIAS